MSAASIIKSINCSKQKLIEMVLDIEKYPEFVPWCLSSKIYEKLETNDTIEIKADLKVGKKFLNQTYTSKVIYFKARDYILVTNLKGPLKRLKNEWLFFEELNDKTRIEFKIDFELHNKFLNKIMEKSFYLGLNKIAYAFEKRAEIIK